MVPGHEPAGQGMDGHGFPSHQTEEVKESRTERWEMGVGPESRARSLFFLTVLLDVPSAVQAWVFATPEREPSRQPPRVRTRETVAVVEHPEPAPLRA